MLDLVAAGKERGVAAHCIEQQTFVRLGAGFAERRSVMKVHLYRLDAKARAGNLGVNPQRNPFVRLNSNDENVQVAQIFVEQNRRRFFEVNGNFGCRFRKPFSDAHVDRHVGPAPVVDEQTRSDEGLRFRIWVDVLFLAITADRIAMNGAFGVLRAHHVGCDFIARPAAQRSHHLDLFVANTVSGQIRGWFHRDKTKKLQQMVLHHVAQGACAFVKACATPYAQRFRRCDLHMIDVVRVPKRRENGISEPQYQDILGSFFTKEMIDPIGLLFRKRTAHDPVKLAR